MQNGQALMRRTCLAAALLLAATTIVCAQNWRSNRSGAPGEFDFYVLALSWSPTFCASEAGRRSREQCEVNPRAQFVLHGLWPQYERGFPENCAVSNRFIPRYVMDKAAKVYPAEGLARYEWNKHGTCSGLAPSEYFDSAARALAKITIPADYQSPRQDIETSPMAVERSFVDANRGLRTDMMSVQCRRNQLTEIRICLSKDLRDFVPCADVDRNACRTSKIHIPTIR